MDKGIVDQELIGKKTVRIVMNDGFIKKCEIISYDDKVVKTVTFDGKVAYIPWSSISRITNDTKGDINGHNGQNRQNREQE